MVHTMKQICIVNAVTRNKIFVKKNVEKIFGMICIAVTKSKIFVTRNKMFDKKMLEKIFVKKKLEQKSV